MEIKTEPTNIQVRFTISDGVHTLNDALNFSVEEYFSLTPEQLEAKKQARFLSWKDSVIRASAIEPPPPTPEELQAQLDQIAANKLALDAEAQNIAATLAALNG